MAKFKNRTILKMAVFAIIMTMVLWLMPAGIISAEGSGSLAELQAAADSANAALATAQTSLDDANAILLNAQAGGIAEEIVSAQATVDSAVLALSAAQAAADLANAALAAAQAGADDVSAAYDVGILCHHAIYLDKSYIGGAGGEATFQLYEGVNPVGSPQAANSANGYHIAWPGLPAGNYSVVEVSGPAGYNVLILPASISINDGNYLTAPDSAFTFTAVNTLKTCPIDIFKLVDGVLPTEGSFSFTVAESVGDLTSTNGISVLIPGSFTLDSSNGYMATFNVKCGVEYIITEDGPPSGFTFGSINSDISGNIINGQSITFTVNCTNHLSDAFVDVVPAAGTITFNNLTIPGSSLLRLVKTSSTTGLPLAGAVYSLYIGSTLIYDLLPTGADGSTLVSLPSLSTVYTVKEKTPPDGYALDPNSYTVTAGADPITITLNVKDDPLGGGEVGTLGLTESIQVLAFTGIDPIIPISGGSTMAAGIAMLLATLRRRNRHSAKHTSKKEDEKSSKWWLSIL